jgi:hypothetical protein
LPYNFLKAEENGFEQHEIDKCISSSIFKCSTFTIIVTKIKQNSQLKKFRKKHINPITDHNKSILQPYKGN